MRAFVWCLISILIVIKNIKGSSSDDSSSYDSSSYYYYSQKSSIKSLKCNDKRLIDVAHEIDGEIFTRTNTESKLYSRLSSQWNAEFNNLMPSAIIMVESANDISIILLKLIIPCSESIKFSVRSAPLGGHLWSGYSVIDNGIVIDLSRLNNIQFSKNDDYLLELEPGVNQNWANQYTAPYLQIFPTSGDCNQFAFGGFLQGGGLSLFIRSAGLSADYIEKADVVLMNGDIITATKYNRYSDLLYGIKGGGAGNFGIVTKYHLSTFIPSTQVISFEVYWLLSSFENNHEKLKLFLRTWSYLQKGNKYKEFTSWFVLLFDNVLNGYVFRMLAIWNGDVNEGYRFWNDVYLFRCECEHLIITERSNVFTTNAWNAVEIHQATFGGQQPLENNVIDARTVKYEWNDAILTQMVNIMISHINDINELRYIWLLVCYGGNMLSNDPLNKETSFGHRDAVGDITLFIGSGDGDINSAIDRLNEIRSDFFDEYVSPFYYPNHPLSIAPVENIPVAYYDCINKPKLYQTLVQIKNKYDPNNLLNNPVTIDINQRCEQY